ncbi:hypothetical protein PG988_001909 [Apiospora saccharicola]
MPLNSLNSSLTTPQATLPALSHPLHLQPINPIYHSWKKPVPSKPKPTLLKMQYATATLATLFLAAALATASPLLAARNDQTQFGWWVQKDCASPGTGYRVTGPEHNEP